jgi:hypothetical protein
LAWKSICLAQRFAQDHGARERHVERARIFRNRDAETNISGGVYVLRHAGALAAKRNSVPAFCGMSG